MIGALGDDNGSGIAVRAFDVWSSRRSRSTQTLQMQLRSVVDLYNKE